MEEVMRRTACLFFGRGCKRTFQVDGRERICRRHWVLCDPYLRRQHIATLRRVRRIFRRYGRNHFHAWITKRSAVRWQACIDDITMKLNMGMA